MESVMLNKRNFEGDIIIILSTERDLKNHLKTKPRRISTPQTLGKKFVQEETAMWGKLELYEDYFMSELPLVEIIAFFIGH